MARGGGEEQQHGRDAPRTLDSCSPARCHTQRALIVSKRGFASQLKMERVQTLLSSRAKLARNVMVNQRRYTPTETVIVSTLQGLS